MQLPAIPGSGLLLLFVGGLSPILAEGPVCSSPPILAGVFCRCLCVFPRQSWPWVQCPAISGWGLLLAVAGGPSPILA